MVTPADLSPADSWSALADPSINHGDPSVGDPSVNVDTRPEWIWVGDCGWCRDCGECTSRRIPLPPFCGDGPHQCEVCAEIEETEREAERAKLQQQMELARMRAWLERYERDRPSVIEEGKLRPRKVTVLKVG